MTELELRDLRKTYRARGRPPVEAVRGLDVRLRSGELLGLLGPSGCGKSTTLRMIAGLETVTGGDVLVGGVPVTDRPARRRNVGVAFENYALYPPLTVRENLAFGLRARRRADRGDVDRRVALIAERVGLTAVLDDRPATLSSGQKQRVSLARALVREPDVLLLDEPLSHLDAAQRDTTRREVKRIQRDLGHTAILVTHDQEEALSLADRIAVMRDGVIEQLGTAHEIYDHPATRFVADFVGEPAINLLPAVTAPDGRAAVSGAVLLPLPVRLPPGREVVVGVRPEDLALTGEDGVRARVLAHEPLLEYGVATLALDGVEDPVAALTDPGTRLARDDRVRVAADPGLTHVFDAETGVSLR
ncbi:MULTISPECIES: ABC transporter ATP-binding protein [Streptomyces]|uniref:ABC transporter ATP-binding protein n=1 Tax=Streptomyces doudnae TaxID=3075536 RepID=A0ABD5EWB1_9ACTN|nr:MULTISPECIES: ABC transporter ATP-binding protein [unclassified Streptomyces]MDT0439022.1 ABC transporter ATP-binding protein [Streptomyces sp. DSM 41981]MYQ63136.1 ATP-binding cassette domain-containing protein [Streptomyces sp. SID4950]SCD51505.1 carbohydrate ABC transporter ATP-binding protein, CUT1 family [Streptomyces sp. SolWspMP-5a-2]